MKIIQSSPSGLVLSEQPLPQIAVGVAIVGIGILMMILTSSGRVETGFTFMPIAVVALGIGWTCLMPRRATVEFDVERNRVQIRSRDILGDHSQDFPLSQFIGAHLIVRSTHGGARMSRRTLGRPVLIFEGIGGEQQLPLHRLFGAPSNGLKLVNEINRWHAIVFGSSNPMNTSLERWKKQPMSDAIAS